MLRSKLFPVFLETNPAAQSYVTQSATRINFVAEKILGLSLEPWLQDHSVKMVKALIIIPDLPLFWCMYLSHSSTFWVSDGMRCHLNIKIFEVSQLLPMRGVIPRPSKAGWGDFCNWLAACWQLGCYHQIIKDIKSSNIIEYAAECCRDMCWSCSICSWFVKLMWNYTVELL